MARAYRTILAAGLLLVSLVACAPAAAPAAPAPAAAPPVAVAPGDPLAAVIDAARREGQLNLVWTENVGSAEGIRRWIEGFNRMYGLQLDVRFTPGLSMPEQANKVGQEFRAGRPATTDVLAAADEQINVLLQEDALEPVDWASWAPSLRDPNLFAPRGVAVEIGSRFPGITYHADRVRGDQVPTSAQDLLDPRYKGRMATTSYAANFATLAVPELWGEQRTREYVNRFADQVSGLIRCGEMERLANGEFDLFALDCGSFVTRRGVRLGASLGHVIPSDAALVSYWYMAVPRNAAHPNAAKLWINYVLSREGQDILYDTTFLDHHLVPGSRTARELDDLVARGVKLTEVDVDFYYKHDEKELARLSDEMQRTLNKK